MTHTRKNQDTRHSFLDKLLKDSHGDIALFQRPNLWLAAWMLLTLVSLFSSSRSTANIAWWLGSAVLTIWALLEISRGVNYFRRALGVFVLLMVLASVFGMGR